MSKVLSKDSVKFSSYSCILNCSFSISSMLLIPVLLYPRINTPTAFLPGIISTGTPEPKVTALFVFYECHPCEISSVGFDVLTVTSFLFLTSGGNRT